MPNKKEIKTQNMTKTHDKATHMTKNQQGNRQTMSNTKERETQNMTRPHDQKKERNIT